MEQNDTSEQAREVLVRIYHEMPITDKVRRIFESYQTGRILAMAGIRELHHGVSEEQVWHLWARRHLGDELYERAYGASCDG